MKQLSGFLVVSVNGGDRIGFSYDTIDDNSGTVVETGTRETFFATDNTLRKHIEAIREYIRKNKLAE